MGCNAIAGKNTRSPVLAYSQAVRPAGLIRAMSLREPHPVTIKNFLPDIILPCPP